MTSSLVKLRETVENFSPIQLSNSVKFSKSAEQNELLSRHEFPIISVLSTGEKKNETFPEKDMVTRFITSIFSSIEKNVHITIVLLICLFIARDQYRRSTVICGVEYKLIF